MRVLGIDAGSRITGYGIVDARGGDCVFVDCGVIRVLPSDPLSVRLKKIHQGLVRIIESLSPEEAAIESVFHASNVQSALKLGHARGVCIHAAAAADLPVYEYSPTEVKSAVTGFGRAEKSQVQLMVNALLKLSGRTDPYDASDALAVAICHVNTHRFARAAAGAG